MKRGSEHSSDGDSAKKKEKKSPPRNDGKTKVVMKDAMKYFGINGDIKVFTIPANLESVCRILDQPIGVVAAETAKETFHERLERAVVWVSTLKPASTLFANWLLLHELRQGNELPTLGRPFYTQIMAAVTNRSSIFRPQFDMYSQTTGHQFLEWQQGNSQILEHTKAEMVTSASTYLINTFSTRKLVFLRWKVADALSEYLQSLPQLKSRQALLYKITQRMLKDGGVQLGDYHGVGDFPEEDPQLVGRVFAIAQQNIDDMARLKTLLADRVRDRWVAKKMAASTPEKPAKMEDVVEKFNGLGLLTLIQEDPAGTIYYYRRQYDLVENLPLTTQYQEHANNMKDQKDQKEKKSTWPFWKKLRMPSFSPLPFNKVGRHFIRIDKKTLLDWKLNVDETEDLWMNSVFNLYSGKKKGRIHQFYEWRHLNNLSSALLILQDDRDHGRFDPTIHRPTLPGASFSTDGIAAHISAYTFPSKHPNITNLPQRGYTGITSKVKVRLQDHTTGVFKLENMKTFRTVQEYADCDLIGVDPGCIEVVAHSRIAAEELNPDARAEMLDRAKNQFVSYSEDRYKKNTGRPQAEEKERSRRQNVQSYKESLQILSLGHKKTFDLDTMTVYAEVRFRADPGMAQELHSKKRSIHRRKRFVRTQRTIAHIAYTIGGGPSRSDRRKLRKKKEDMLERRKVVFFGKGQWTGVRGHVTVPRKKLIHVLACNYLVLLVDEYCTSKLCPYDFSELQDMGNRIRQCETENHGATADQLFTMDRDVIGSMNILQKGVYHLLGRNLQPLYQSVDAA